MIKITTASMVFCFVIGQTTTSTDFTNIGTIANAGAMSLIGILLYTLIVHQLPKERRERDKHAQDLMTKVCDEFRSVQDRQHEDNQVFNKNMNIMTKQCEKTRGTMVGLVRGSVVGDTDDG